MGKQLLSVGLDVGTTSTQMILSALTVENRAGAFSVPQMQITQRRVRYKSPIHFTPLLHGQLVDADALRLLILEEYRRAGICREDIDTGAVIITGETSRKENAATVLHALSDLAGDFVVATAGPDLESVLAAKGSGAVALSHKSETTVLHMDIGGGTSNLALIQQGQIIGTTCLNVGGRLLKWDDRQRLCYISPVLKGIFHAEIGERTPRDQLLALAETLVHALEMAAGLRPPTDLLDTLTTQGAASLPASLLPQIRIFSFSGGVADCIDTTHPDLAFGDLGPILGQAIRRSLLCRGQYRLGAETIRATVIGAGSHAIELSGSTVYYQNITFPLKNLPVVADIRVLSRLDGPGILLLPEMPKVGYLQISQLADTLAAGWPNMPVLLAMEADMAKALGHALALRFPSDTPILCLDRLHLEENSYLDVGTPLSSALPVVIKTLILSG